MHSLDSGQPARGTTKQAEGYPPSWLTHLLAPVTDQEAMENYITSMGEFGIL